MLNYLTIQIQSNNYEDWNTVASCNYATEEHLIAVAKKCSEIYYSSQSYRAEEVAKSICNNPAATGNVLKELAKSPFTTVTSMAHEKLEKMQ